MLQVDAPGVVNKFAYRALQQLLCISCGKCLLLDIRAAKRGTAETKNNLAVLPQGSQYPIFNILKAKLYASHFDQIFTFDRVHCQRFNRVVAQHRLQYQCIIKIEPVGPLFIARVISEV